MSLIEKRTEREATFGDLTGKFTYNKTYTYINFKNTFPFSWLYEFYVLFRYCLLKIKIKKNTPIKNIDVLLKNEYAYEKIIYKYQKIIKKIKKMFNKNIDDFDILDCDAETCNMCHKSFKDDVFCDFMVNYGDEMNTCRECVCKKYGIKNTYKDIVEFLENNRGGILFYIHEKEYEKQYKYIDDKKYKMINETTVNNALGRVVKKYNSLESSFFDKIQL